MKNLLIAAGVVGAAISGVLLYRRNRNHTSRTMHDIADAAGEAHDVLKKQVKKNNREMKTALHKAMA